VATLDPFVTLAAGGDVNTGHNPPESAFAAVLNELREADIRFAQVERLYSARGQYQLHSLASHMEVRQPPTMAGVFRSVPFDVLSIASNHSGDYGPEALADTYDTFKELGIPTIGAGHNIAQAREPVIVERKGLRIAFLGYCSILLPQYWATDERPGCAPMRAHTFYEPYEYQPGSPARIVTAPYEGDLPTLLQDVRKAAQNADLVVVSLHWGLHYIHWPLQYQTQVAHAAIDAGACLILGHHPHQQQAAEVYRGGVIFYSLGNLSVHRRGGGHAYCMPDGYYTQEAVYSVEVDLGQTFHYKRHWNEGGIAYIELDRSGVRRATYLPTMLDAKGAPEVVRPEDPQFEKSRQYLQWIARNVEGGVRDIGVAGGRYVLYRRGAAD
jgi:poly-gamma-glutamate capsule biosynthesis protein CapA/YwtB (metallophosphatase superfamily)